MVKIKTKVKSAKDFSDSARILIIEEYLNSDVSKRDIWEKYTGQDKEHGSLLKWMNHLGYSDKPKYNPIFVSQAIIPFEPINNYTDLSSEELKIKLIEMEQLLADAQIKADGYNLMIEIAEKEFQIPIRKKFITK